MTVRRLSLGCALALLLTGCMVPVSRTRPVPVNRRVASGGLAALAGTLESGDAVVIARGITTGHVFDLELRNDGDGDLVVQYRGSFVLAEPARWQSHQRYLALAEFQLSVGPGRTARVPVRGFCLNPGRPPLPAGTRIPIRAALVQERRSTFPVEDGVVRTADGEFPVRVPGAVGIPPEHLRVTGGQIFLLPADGRLRRHDASRPWKPEDDVPSGLVSVRDGHGKETARFVLAREEGAELSLASMPGEDGAVLFPPELGLRHRLAEAVVEVAPTVVREQGVGGFDYPATTVAQHGIWKLSAAEPEEQPEGGPSTTARSIDAAAEMAAAEAEAKIANEAEVNVVDFSLLDLSRKPQ